MLREIEISVKQRLNISRISPYLDHYDQNCGVTGLHEIEYILKAVEKSKG